MMMASRRSLPRQPPFEALLAVSPRARARSSSLPAALYSLIVGDSKNKYGDVDVGNPTLLQVPYKLLKVRNAR